jgi:hypothetical protein
MVTGRSKRELHQIRLPHGFLRGHSYWHRCFRECSGHSLLPTANRGRMIHPVSVLVQYSFYGCNVCFNVSWTSRVGTKRDLAYSELFVLILVDSEFQWPTIV